MAKGLCPGVGQSHRKESVEKAGIEREREASIPWGTWKINKALTQDLYRSQRHRASSRGGLESPGRKLSSAGFHGPENLVREREKEGHREPSL